MWGFITKTRISYLSFIITLIIFDLIKEYLP